jgi:uncharacterized protein YgbK (DUF1537 family)
VADRKVRAACQALDPGGPGLFYKKVDSTLRGPVAAEILGAIQEGARVPAVFCPAFPEQGRTVVTGELRAAGIRVPLREVLGKLPVRIFDAATSEDLDQIAAAVLRDPIPLLVGSAGLARAVSGFYGRAVSPPPANPAEVGRAILCIGSDHPVTAHQVARLQEEGPRHALHRVDFETVPPILGQLESMRGGGLLFCGGDTALYLCRAFGVQAILLEREMMPGVPLGRLLGGPGHGLAVITKSGGFGGPDTLVRAARLLSTQYRSAE